jgi:integrase/recombinase XerC
MGAKMLSLYRRHLKKCQHRKKGQDYTKCSCPIWCDGDLNGQRYRRSLQSRDWQRAIRKLAALEDPRRPVVKPIKEAVTGFQQHTSQLETSTQRKYANVLRHFQTYCDEHGIESLTQLRVEDIDGYRAGRKIARTTAKKELETLRQFLTFCKERNWIDDNPAKRIKTPKNVKPSEVVPYTASELGRIFRACDLIGRSGYERSRGRAMILLLQYTGLRVSDVATLARDRVGEGQILVRTLKTGATVHLPVPPDLEKALAALPAPRGSDQEARYFFWNGVTSRRAVIGIAERTLAAIFKKSDVNRAHANRFRHTLATRLLGVGAGEQEVADVLGISPNIVRKHYAKWSLERQQRITGFMNAAHFGTPVVREKINPVIN